MIASEVREECTIGRWGTHLAMLACFLLCSWKREERRIAKPVDRQVAEYGLNLFVEELKAKGSWQQQHALLQPPRWSPVPSIHRAREGHEDGELVHLPRATTG